MSAEAHGPSAGEYIQHHLQHLQKDFSFNSVKQTVELLSEMVENQAKGVIHNAQSRKLISPLALTVFVWIFLMNFMDMLPVDLIPQ